MACQVYAVVGGSRYPCRSHENGHHHFAAHWPACPAPFCRLAPGHRELHDIPAGEAVYATALGGYSPRLRELAGLPLLELQGRVLRMRRAGIGWRSGGTVRMAERLTARMSRDALIAALLEAA